MFRWIPDLTLLFMIFFTLFSRVTSATAQPTEIGRNIRSFRIDPMGYCYFQKGDDIIKLNRDRKEMVRYSMKDLGTPTSFDVNNPLRVLIFYSEFAVVRVLDNNLISQSEIQLRPLGILQPKVLAGSPDQGIWIYDDISGTLSKVNTLLGKTAVSVDLSQLLGKRPNPVSLLAGNDWVVMLNQLEIIVFDQFGTKIKSIQLQAPPSLFQLNENQLKYNQGDQLITEDLRLKTLKTEDFPCNSKAESVSLSNGRCWWLESQVLYEGQ